MHRLSSFTLVATLLLLTLVTFQNTQARTVFICRPGQTYTLSGTTSPSTALLLLFDGSHIGGTTSGPDGKYRLQLAMGNERPGDYLLEVQVRASRHIIREALCRVPAEGEEEQAANPAQSQAPEAPPTASLTSQPVGANPTMTSTSQAGGGGGSAPSPSASPSATGTRGSTGGSTQTASITPSASLTPSRTATRSTSPQATATATRTATQSSVDTSEYELLAEVDEEDPVVGEVITIYGTLVKVSTNRGITDVQINVSYSFNGGSGVWCTTTIEDPDGYWECEGTVTNAMAYKDVVLTVQAVVNGKPLQAQVTIRPYSEET